MDEKNEQREIVVNASYEFFVLAIVIFSIINSLVLLLSQNSNTKSVISIIELGISLFLIVDFITRLIRARSKRNYFLRYYGWLDFLGSLPIPGFRLGRLIKAIIFYPRLRRADIKEMEYVVIERRAKSTLLVVLLVGIVVLELSSIAILNAEQGSANANIKNASDALWWGYVTVTTVGYGDRYPVTNQGRIVGLFLLTVGVAIFSVVTSFLADWFRQSRQSKPKEVAEENKLPGAPVDSLQEIKRLIDAQEATNQRSIETLAQLRASLAELENSLAKK
jgi:voltage-gated potassium channel